MKIKALFLIFVCLLAGYARAAETISVAYEGIYEKSQAYVQLKNFVRDSLAQADIKVEFIPLPLVRANMMNSEGHVDAQMGRAPSVLKEFPNLRATKFPILYTNVRFLYPKAKTDFDETHLKNYRGVSPLNNQGLIAKIKEQKLPLTEVKDLEQGLSMLKFGHADYMLLPEEIIASIFKEHPELKDQMKVSDGVFVRFPLYFVVNQSKESLLPKIEKAFRATLSADVSAYPLIKGSLNKSLE